MKKGGDKRKVNTVKDDPMHKAYEVERRVLIHPWDVHLWLRDRTQKEGSVYWFVRVDLGCEHQHGTVVDFTHCCLPVQLLCCQSAPQERYVGTQALVIRSKWAIIKSLISVSLLWDKWQFYHHWVYLHSQIILFSFVGSFKRLLEDRDSQIVMAESWYESVVPAVKECVYPLHLAGTLQFAGHQQILFQRKMTGLLLLDLLTEEIPFSSLAGLEICRQVTWHWSQQKQRKFRIVYIFIPYHQIQEIIFLIIVLLKVCKTFFPFSNKSNIQSDTVNKKFLNMH